MQAIILSSFPRSGNTWIRFVLATALLGRRPSSEELDRILPDAHKPLAPLGDWITQPGLFLKSHFAPPALTKYLISLQQNLPPSHALRGLRVLHIVRNPFDVALSVARFYEVADADMDTFYDAFIDPTKVAPSSFAKWGFGNWKQNTERWLAAAEAGDVPVGIVRYEDLTADPVAAFADIFGRYGLAPKLPVEECVALCAPAALRQAEDEERASGQPGIFGSYLADKKPGVRFIGAAKAGGYLDRLSAEQIDAGLASLGETMEAVGYDVASFRAPEMLRTA